MAGMNRGQRPDKLPGTKDWSRFVERAFHKFATPELFLKAAQTLRKRSPLPGDRIAHVLFGPNEFSIWQWDSLVDYISQLLNAGEISIPDVLLALFYGSNLRPTNQDATTESNTRRRETNPLELDDVVLHRLAVRMANGRRPRTAAEKRKTIVIVTSWLKGAVSLNPDDIYVPKLVSNRARNVQRNHLLAEQVRGDLGLLLLNIMENDADVIKSGTSMQPDFRQEFIRSLSAFIPLMAQTSTQLASRLELLQKQHDLIDHEAIDDMAGAGSVLEIERLRLDTVMDLPPVDSTHSRIGLYIYINALLAGRPLTEDSTILTHLHTRYKGDMQSLTIDFLVASFDVLANAVLRRESRDSLFSLRSFLINKVPHVISMLSSSFFLPLTPEFCIEQALKFVDPNVFPSFASSFNNMLGSHSTVGDVRQDFLLACALHGLILEDSIPRIYGEVPMSGLPAGGRYFKDTLVAQCQNNPQRLEELVNETESMDGNAAAVAGAVTELIRNMCATKDTMSLKSICSSLSRKPQALDVMLQYASPTSILQPLCQLLNEWKYEEDQGEHQPVYEDFAGILLLALAMIFRYDLSTLDLGVNGDQSFMSQLLDKGLLSKSKDDLSDDDSKRLSNWIRGLYETQGITEEVMATCPPQDFYLLVSTLFDQSVLACSQEVIKLETVKTGLEMLLEPWFLPSLCIALTWLANELARPGTNKAVLIQILHKLMRPSSISGDAKGMHTAILSMVSGLLEKPLRDLQSKEPSRYDIEPLLDDLNSHARYKRNCSSSVSELHEWTSTPSGGIRQSIRSSFQSLMSWGTNLPMIVPAPNYTHRQILSAVKVIGSAPTLQVILDEVKQQTEQGNGPLALDIATEMIYAPTSDDQPEIVNTDLMLPATRSRSTTRQISLRDRLKLEMEEAPKKLANDSAMASTVVRLHRRVEAIIAEAAQAQALPADLGAQEIMQAVELTNAVDSAAADAAAVEAAAEGAIVANQSLDLGAADSIDINAAAADAAMDLDLSNAATAMGDQTMDDMLQGSGMGSTEDDIFGDLQMDPDNNFNFDDLVM